jgi:hypothetical protein
MNSQTEHKPEIGPASEAAQYIGAVAEELARLAKSHNFEALAYILEMARVEADQVCQDWSGQGDRRSSRLREPR